MEIERKADPLPFQSQEGIKYRVEEIAGFALHTEGRYQVQLRACKIRLAQFSWDVIINISETFFVFL